MDKNIAKKLRQLNALIKMTSLINSTLDTREIRRRAIEAAQALVNAEAGSLLLIDSEKGELFFEVATGEKGEKVKEIRLKIGEGIAGWVAEKGEAVIVHDVENDPRFFKGVDEKSKFKTKSLICVPVKTKDRIIGVLEAINKRDGRFDTEDKEILQAFANQVAIAIENANLYQELKDTFYGTIEALAETIEKRDPYTGGHTKRVMNYAVATGKELGLSESELEALKLSAILHDIGKIGIRDNILLKQSKLTEEEAMIMNMHPMYGAEILGHIKQLKDVIPGMRGHHERYDGTGYPDHLRGEEIPLFARIISVADAYDAMTTDRPYRKALNKDVAYEELKRFSGRHFDPQVVNAFIKAMNKELRSFENLK